ncbi:hypothetical protein ASG60_09610 [Methylobacterium sp. Leaf469]|jgi:hypothetical protein|uniref:hypothetical protein n=1 Tax=Methylobacterium sp. Leaf469 TaxID=1736387 RepID=UPI0006FEFD13|nr:hypothetical protein [Methylobacterium sp. Leaf469]KQT89905.1 hypothetical protein ASG60_09610 [Methylobacterium sp. Leaf469]USU34130.1 hypothetical protein NG677_10930 [Methylobacterium sp. OTU13CASTA1]
MAATDRAALARKIAGDAAWLALAGVAAGVGRMISHEDGSAVFCLRWEATTMGFSLLGALVGAVMVGLIRWRMWSRGHPQALD